MKTYTLRDLPANERPRERLVKYGVESLSLQELLSLIFGRGVKGESVTNISQKLLANFISLNNLSEASVEELKEIKGLGLAKACQLKACFEISKRLVKEESLNKNKNVVIKSPKDIFPLLKEKIINFHKEYFLVASLDNRNKVINVDTVSVGTLNSSLIHPRETFETAIKNHAATIILCHNHPSGELKPSEDDLIVTQNLVKASKLLGINVSDHLIITKDGYFSFKEKKII
ncbi:MAG: DNA repair protein RadC [Candidatus Roizmanbacteria bacterium]|nr:DNA repair protein RadC [Candidatus Roizmanbacteria bacterium]